MKKLLDTRQPISKSKNPCRIPMLLVLDKSFPDNLMIKKINFSPRNLFIGIYFQKHMYMNFLRKYMKILRKYQT